MFSPEGLVVNERVLVEEWWAVRRRSLHILPVAVVLFVALGCVTYFERLYQSEVGFIPGVLVGTLGYWVILEAMTVVRVNRLLRRAAPDHHGPGT